MPYSVLGGDVRRWHEMRELPGPARECAESDTRHKIEVTVAECDVVAGPGQVEDDVAVQRESPEISGLGIDDLEPTSIASRFEDVIVQISPAWPW